MKKVSIAIILLALLAMAYLAIKGANSRSGSVPGLVDGRLHPCPDRPNCVCSEYPQDKAHFVAAIEVSGMPAIEVLKQLQAIAVELGGRVEIVKTDYLAISFRSTVFGFVDDLEMRVDKARQQIHLRSAARVGRSDLDVNRKRIESIKLKYRALTEDV